MQNHLPAVLAVAGALFWTKRDKTISSSEIFTILAVIALLDGPMDTIIMALPAISNAVASFPRIQKFLCLEEHHDHRSITANDTSMKLTDVSITGASSEKPILKNINMRIEPGSVVMISGPVGCGKTTLLKALIGEVPLQTGAIESALSLVAYADQVAWLENTTLRENICHGDQDETWYRQVLNACALDQDIEALPLGDQTVLGNRATNISGGQKQRIVCPASAIETRT
jgi:ABC-type bacteriocin/lantibiotic exporter with double-glycine peptidase domain